MDWKKLITELQGVGVTQVQMAERCGCAQTTISDLLNGRIERPRYEIGAALVAMKKSVADGSALHVSEVVHAE